jgi:hypothetical protein
MKTHVLVTNVAFYCLITKFTVFLGHYCYRNMPALFCSAAISSHLISSHLCQDLGSYLFSSGFQFHTP